MLSDSDPVLDAAFGAETHPSSDNADPLDMAFAPSKPTKQTDREIKEGPLGFVNALGEIAGKSIGNIPMAAVHGIADLASRATGHGPRPSQPTFPLSPNAESAAQGIGDALSSAAEPYRLKSAEPFLNEYVAPVAADVAAVAPVAGAIKGVAGRLMPAETAPVASAQSVVNQTAARQSGGAAGAAANISTASPELQQAIATKGRQGAVNPDALQAHLEADQHGIQLTKGQATQDPVQVSEERNHTDPRMVGHFKEQEGQMVDAIDNLRREASPTTVGNDVIENGQTVVDALKAHDEPVQADIRAKYKALTDANGGNIPIDTGSFLNNVDASLKKNYLTKSVPAGASELLESLRANEPLDFEGFEAARSRLAEAQRAGGSEGAAAKIIRGQLEQLPLSPEAANLKGLADNARAAAKSRFDALDADPAYQAAVDDMANGVKRGQPSPLADRFLDKYALGTAPKANVDLMMGKLDPDAQGAVTSHTLNALRKSAVTPNGTVSANGYNGAMQKYAPKLDSLVAPEVRDNLESLGRTITRAKVAPPGNYVNYSKSGVIMNAAKGAAEHAVNAKTFGVYGMGKKLLTGDRFVKEALEPGAGLDQLKNAP